MYTFWYKIKIGFNFENKLKKDKIEFCKPKLVNNEKSQKHLLNSGFSSPSVPASCPACQQRQCLLFLDSAYKKITQIFPKKLTKIKIISESLTRNSKVLG